MSDGLRQVSVAAGSVIVSAVLPAAAAATLAKKVKDNSLSTLGGVKVTGAVLLSFGEADPYLSVSNDGRSIVVKGTALDGDYVRRGPNRPNTRP